MLYGDQGSRNAVAAESWISTRLRQPMGRHSVLSRCCKINRERQMFRQSYVDRRAGPSSGRTGPRTARLSLVCQSSIDGLAGTMLPMPSPPSRDEIILEYLERLPYAPYPLQ